MASPLDVFSEALQRASNPINPPPARPSALDMSSPTSSLDPTLPSTWNKNAQFTPPNTATEIDHARWYPPSPQLDDSPVVQSGRPWDKDSKTQSDSDYRASQSFSEPEADFHQQAVAFEGMPSVHIQSEYPSPLGLNSNFSGEPPQTKASAADDLFSDVDDEEMLDPEEIGVDDNIFHMSGLEQQVMHATQQDLYTPHQTIPGIRQTPGHATVMNVQDYADPTCHPSPTESQLVAEGFEFHNKVPEEVQINRFNDKAFRKALREVQSDLPRKQQWYAWSKAQQMLESEPESASTAEMDPAWGSPMERQYEHLYELDLPSTTEAAVAQVEDSTWGSSPQPVPSTTAIHFCGLTGLEKAWTINEQCELREFNTYPTSSPASTGGFAVGQGDWHSGRKEDKIDQDRLNSHTLGKLIAKVAEEHRSRRNSEEIFSDEDFQQEESSTHCSVQSQDYSLMAEPIIGRRPEEPSSLSYITPTSLAAPPLPPRPSLEQPTSPHHDADLLRPHTNTILRRSPSPSRTHLPPPISPNRRSPSPWIEHPGINRPDTPRPSRPTSPIHASIRQSIEPETPSHARIRESTPAFEDRSPSPSPVSHTQHDTLMTDAPLIPYWPLHLHSSPDPLSSPPIHGDNTVTAPSTPLPQSSPFRPAPPPIPSSSLSPKKTRRKSMGSKISSPERSKSRNVTAVQGSNISKATRKVTQVAQKVKSKAKPKPKATPKGNVVADAVARIEAAERDSPRRSGRIAAGKKSGK